MLPGSNDRYSIKIWDEPNFYLNPYCSFFSSSKPFQCFLKIEGKKITQVRQVVWNASAMFMCRKKTITWQVSGPSVCWDFFSAISMTRGILWVQGAVPVQSSQGWGRVCPHGGRTSTAVFSGTSYRSARGLCFMHMEETEREERKKEVFTVGSVLSDPCQAHLSYSWVEGSRLMPPWLSWKLALAEGLRRKDLSPRW